MTVCAWTSVAASAAMTANIDGEDTMSTVFLRAWVFALSCLSDPSTHSSGSVLEFRVSLRGDWILTPSMAFWESDTDSGMYWYWLRLLNSRVLECDVYLDCQCRTV